MVIMDHWYNDFLFGFELESVELSFSSLPDASK